MAETIKGIVQHLYNTASELAIQNVILKAGEIGLESDTLRIKIGDGVTNWNDLDYTDSSDYVDMTDNLAYEIKLSKSNVVIDSSGILGVKTLTLSKESGVDIRNTVEVVNESSYRLIITDGTAIYWCEPGESFSLYFVGSTLKRTTGRALIYDDPVNTGGMAEGNQTELVQDYAEYTILVHDTVNQTLSGVGITDSSNNLSLIEILDNNWAAFNNTTRLWTLTNATHSIKKIWRKY